jgi:regulator of cell morphogenesis and NO signaling
MEIFVKENKMATLLRSNYHLLPVINRFGIRLGFKDKTIDDICTKNSINPDFFLAIINTFHNKSYFPEDKLLAFSPVLIINYLRKTHQYYMEYFLPKIEKLLEQLISGCTKNCHELKMIDSFYKKYKNELMLHMMDEEENVFPYVLELVNSNKRSVSGYSIQSFEKEHLNVEIKLNDLKNLIIKYIEPSYNDNDCNEFLIMLFRFEQDIKDHDRIEEKILFPQVIRIEKELG